MAWLQICQGLMLLGWLVGLVLAVIRAAIGRDKQEPTGAVGIFVVLVWCSLTATVMWRSGAISTILPVP